MTRSPTPELQRAIQFLLNPGLAKERQTPLPDRPDYDCLSRYASELGQEFSPDAVKEAFRQIMRARLVASRKLSRTGGGKR
jgi:hypothetical protein